MARKNQEPLKNGEIEITWLNGWVERIQTQGFAANGATVVLDMGHDKVVIPVTSIRQFRVKSLTN